jgi:tetratricopeptide (TPR) repeat protein
LPTRRDPPIVVSCTTCHHGIAQPRTIQQVLLMAYAAGGIDSTIGQYRALRARYYGSAAYDFGEVPLSDVAVSIAAQGKIKDALRLHLLNAELLPNSSFAFRQLGFSYLKNGDTASAVTAWQHRLDIDPENPEAKQLLSQIRKP